MLHTLDTDEWEHDVWCGPGVISALTGCSVKKATEIVAAMQSKAPEAVKGTFHEETIQALSKLGYSVREVDLEKRYHQPVTIQKYLSERPAMERVFPVLMSVSSGDTSHCCAVHFDYFCDNWTKKPVHYSKMPKPRRRLWNAWTVQKMV